MKKFIPALLLFFFAALSVDAEDDSDWKTEDTALQCALSALTIADWTQTLHVARNPDKYDEGGFAEKFIGEHPNTSDVNKYFAASLVTKTAVAFLLPKPYRTYWQISLIAISYSYVQKNRRRSLSLGLSAHF